jgi:N-acetylglucosaminyldiphosphoundecaprenol N-acetyl-beta-D-mannosaminyltransferase
VVRAGITVDSAGAVTVLVVMAVAEVAVAGAGSDRQRAHVLGVPVDLMDRRGVEERLRSCLATPGLRHIVTLNPEQIMAACADHDLRDLIAATDLITVDGVGLALALRIAGLKPVERVTGVQIVELLARSGAPLFFLGGKAGAAEEARHRLLASNAGPVTGGAWSHGRSGPKDDQEAIDRITASGAQAVLVAYGVPAQLTWIERNRMALEDCGVRLAVGVGGALDYFAGMARRPPDVVNRIGLEWAWRLAHEPHRLGRQRVLPKFAILAGREAIGRRLGRR